MRDSIPNHRKRKCRFERELNVDLKTRDPVAKPNAATEGRERLCPDWGDAVDSVAKWLAGTPELDPLEGWLADEVYGSDSSFGPPPSFMN